MEWLRQRMGLVLAFVTGVVLLSAASAAGRQLGPEDLKSLDGLWEGTLAAYEARGGKLAPSTVAGPQQIRLTVRRTQIGLQYRDARGEWDQGNRFLASFDYQTADGTLIGRYLKSGRDEDGRWIEYQTIYLTRRSSGAIDVHWLRAVNNLDLPESNPDSKWALIRTGHLRRVAIP